MSEPLLDLTTAFERDVVRIDGQAFEMLNPGELSIMQLHRIEKIGQRMREITQSEVEEEQKADALGRLSREACGLIFADCPAEVLDRLSDVQRIRVMQAFASSSRPAAGLMAQQPAREESEAEGLPTSA